MSFDTRKQSIPQCFVDKIEADKVVDSFKRNSVVDISTPEARQNVKRALVEQRSLRQKCSYFIALAKGTPPINGGSQGGGQVFIPQNVEAMAA